MVDDVEIKVARNDAISPNGFADQWEYVPNDASGAHNGKGYWWNHDPAANDYLGAGLDNALITQPIDLTNAKNPTLSAYFKFNVYWGTGGVGRPPDGFRVEVSDNNGVAWKAINMGVRSSWNVSGSETTHDGISDGTSYTGIIKPGDKQYWVESSTLYRLNCDLSGWRGSVVLLRFRVVTCTDMQHYADANAPRGFYIDDIIVTGETISHGYMALPPRQAAPSDICCSLASVETTCLPADTNMLRSSSCGFGQYGEQDRGENDSPVKPDSRESQHSSLMPIEQLLSNDIMRSDKWKMLREIKVSGRL